MVAPHSYGEDDEDTFGRDDPFASEQLVLTDADDDRLPWLEASDDGEDVGGIDTGRIAGFTLLILLIFAAIAAAYWWVWQRETANELIPQGGTIAAQEGPYKVRPTDSGGKTFEGTGDTSFEVGEGQSREGRLAVDPEPAPQPSPASTDQPDGSNGQTPAPVDTPPTGPVVQVGAYANRANAQEGWQTLKGQTTHLNGVKHQIVRGKADIGIVYRLQAVPGSLSAAKQLCNALRDDGVACQVKR